MSGTILVRPTDVLTHQSVGILQYPSDDPAREHQYFTLKGRLEFRKDYKGGLWAASQTPGIYRLDFNAAEDPEDEDASDELFDAWCDAMGEVVYDHLESQEDHLINQAEMLLAGR